MSAPALTGEDRRALLQVARDAIRAHLAGGKAPEGSAAVQTPGGAFVTLRRRKDGALRGCVGTMETDAPLVETVARMAVAAAVSDTRFDPVREDELSELAIEISALGPLRAVRPEDVEVGPDGLLVREGGRQGVLLPQVATDHGWDRQTFLEKTCWKAGLPKDAWRRAGATICAFSATVFGEDASGADPEGRR